MIEQSTITIVQALLEVNQSIQNFDETMKWVGFGIVVMILVAALALQE